MDRFTIFITIYWTLFVLVLLFIVVGVPLLIVFRHSGPIDLTFTVESTTVKAYNLTSDNRLFCIINLAIRVRNLNPKKHTLIISGVDMEVRKGKHHKLADDALGYFSLSPNADTLVAVEAVGLGVGLRRKIAAELKADVAAGVGRVNAFFTGFVGSDYLDVKCRNVVVDFSQVNAGRVQGVNCGVDVTPPASD